MKGTYVQIIYNKVDANWVVGTLYWMSFGCIVAVLHSSSLKTLALSI